MKKILSLVLALAMMLSLCSFASAEGFDGEIKVWVAEATVDFTKAQIENFKAAHPEYANMTVVVEPVGEGDAATKMITDVEAGADIFGFAQDQLGRLVAAGALEVVADEKVCPICGAKADSKFCPQCGAPMEAPAAPVVEEAPVEEAPAFGAEQE